eukprot:PhF_6_TR21044/c0_g1_i1/m.30288
MEFTELILGSCPEISPDGNHCAYVTNATNIIVARRLRHSHAPLCTRLCDDEVSLLRWGPESMTLIACIRTGVRNVVFVMTLHHDPLPNRWSLQVAGRIDEGMCTIKDAGWLATAVAWTYTPLELNVWGVRGGTKLLSVPAKDSELFLHTPSKQYLVCVGVQSVTYYDGDSFVLSTTWKYGSPLRPTSAACDHTGYLLAILFSSVLEVYTCTGHKVQEIPHVSGVEYSAGAFCCSMNDGGVMILAGSESLHAVRVIQGIPSPHIPCHTLQEEYSVNHVRYVLNSSTQLNSIRSTIPKDTNTQLVTLSPTHIAFTELHRSNIVHIMDVSTAEATPTVLVHQGPCKKTCLECEPQKVSDADAIGTGYCLFVVRKSCFLRAYSE